MHPGGPYWAKKDDGSWSLPKGEYEPDEDPLEVAFREFREELGVDPAGAHELRCSSGRCANRAARS